MLARACVWSGVETVTASMFFIRLASSNSLRKSVNFAALAKNCLSANFGLAPALRDPLLVGLGVQPALVDVADREHLAAEDLCALGDVIGVARTLPTNPDRGEVDLEVGALNLASRNGRGEMEVAE